MKVKLLEVSNFGRKEYKPVNELGRNVAEWLDKKHLSNRDKCFIEKIGLETVVLNYEDEE